MITGGEMEGDGGVTGETFYGRGMRIWRRLGGRLLMLELVELWVFLAM